MKTMPPRLKRLSAVFALASLFVFSASPFAAAQEAPAAMVPATPFRGAPPSHERGPDFAQFVKTPAHIAATVTSVANGAWSNPATWDTGVPTPTDDVVIGAGTTVTIDTTPVTVNSLAVNGTLEYDATLRAVTVTTHVSIAPGGTLQTNPAGAQTGHTLTVGGNLTNDGTLDLSTSANTSGARLTFTGAASNTFSGTGATTDLRTLTINKGTSNANVLEVTTSALSVQGTVVDGTPMAFLTITNGTLKISGTFALTGRTFTTAAYSVPATGGFWLNNPNYTVSGQNGSPTLTGLGTSGTGVPGSAALLRITAGTLNIGTSSGNSMGFGNNTTVIVEGGAVNATGRFGVATNTHNLTYTQTGGAITVCTIGNASSTQASFDLGQGVGPDVILSGGTITIRINCTGVPARDYRNQQGNTGLGISNTVLQFGDALSGAAKTFNAEGLLPNVIVSNASAGHTLLFRPPTFFNNSARDMTINSGCTFNIGNQIYLQNGNTVTNDGTLTANGLSARFIWFPAGGNGTYQGSGVSTGVLTSWETQMASLTMSQASQLVVRRIILFTGNLFGSNKLTLGDNSATLNPIQIGNVTTPSAAGTFDVAPTFDLGAGGQQISYLRTTLSRTTGPEVNPGRALAHLTYNDNDVTHSLTIAGGDITVSGTTALTNGRVITGANTLVANGTVTRTTGYVDGLLQKPVAVGGPVARTFEVGDALAYSPVNVTFANVSGAGTLTGTATGGDHAQLGSSDIVPGKSVNRNWTLTNTGTTFTTADAVFNFVPADIDGGANPNIFVVRKYDSPNWSAPTTGTRTATSTQATGITSFSDFAVGEPPTYTIVASAGTGGSISPSGSVIVPIGNNQAFTITAEPCYTIADVVVDDVSVGPVSNYAFTDVQTDHTIVATFAAVPPTTIAASAGLGGTITPSGDVSVACGADQTFTIAPDLCHAIADVLVDNVSVGAVTSYTFTSPTTDHTISATFSVLMTVSETHTPASCNGGANGTVDLTVNGGTGPFSYAWSNGANTEDVSGLIAGTYSVTVTDANACTAGLEVTITEPPALALTETHVDVATCGGTNGSIDLTVGGGTPPYSYSWTNGATTEDLSGLGPGTYTVTVTDANACTAQLPVTIVAPGAPTLAATQVNVSCNGGSNGAVDLTVNGGTGPFGYLWSNGATTEDISGLMAGTYNVTVTDANSCVTVLGVTITQPPALVMSETHVNDCGGGGSVDLTVAGGTAPYSYAWSGGETTEDIDSGLAAGTYSVTVTDANSCTQVLNVTIETGQFAIVATANAGGTLTPSGTTNVACGGDQTYTITANPNYAISQILVDSSPVAPTTSYTFTNVYAPHTIEVTFSPIVAVINIPSTFSLGAVAPNPTQGNLNVRFGLPAPMSVRVSIIDLQGRELAVLSSGELPAGWHNAAWDGRTAHGKAGAGIYFVSLRGAGKSQMQKFVLTR